MHGSQPGPARTLPGTPGTGMTEGLAIASTLALIRTPWVQPHPDFGFCRTKDRGDILGGERLARRQSEIADAARTRDTFVKVCHQGDCIRNQSGV